MIAKLLTALLSSLVLSISLAMLTYSNYLGFWSLFIVYLMYSGPVYVLGGVPISLLLDRFLVKLMSHYERRKYAIQLIIYSIAGIFITFIFLFMLSNGKYIIDPHKDVNWLYVIGILAALLYLHIQEIILNVKKSA